MSKYSMEMTLASYQVDEFKKMRPSAFMQLAQEIAMSAADPIGFGYDVMMAHDAVWVLSRLHIRFEDYPLWREKVSLQSWHKGMNGLMFNRDYQMLSQDGSVKIAGTSSWVLLNPQTRRLVRPDSLAGIVPETAQDEDSAIDEQAPKLVFPKDGDAQCTNSHTVSYSDIDFIGHTNNVQYLVWAMDSIDPSWPLEHQLKDLYINFVRETKLDDIVDIYTLEDGDTIWVQGEVDGTTSFIAKLVF